MCDQVMAPIGPYLGGFTGRVSKVDTNGTVTTVADNLPSGIDAQGDVQGPADVAFIRDHLYVLNNGGCSKGLPDNPAGILRIEKDGTFQQTADLSAFLQAHPVQNPPPLLERMAIGTACSRRGICFS